MAEFNWAVTTGTALRHQPTVRVVQFGDGYEQRRAAGLNHNLRQWDVRIDNQEPVVAAEIESFLTARGGVEAFTWWSPEDVHVTVICERWDIRTTRARTVLRMSISAVFREVIT